MINDHFGDWNHKKVIGLGMHIFCYRELLVLMSTRCRPPLQDKEFGPCACQSRLEFPRVFKIASGGVCIVVVRNGGAVGEGQYQGESI